MRRGEWYQPVQALAPNRADDSLADRIGRGRPCWRLQHGQPESADGLVQMPGKDAIAIMEEVSVTVPEGDCFPQLL